MARRRRTSAKKIDWKKWLPLGILLMAVPLLAAAKGTGTTPTLPSGGDTPPPNGSNPTPSLPSPGTPNSYNCNIPRGIRNNNPGNLLNGNYLGTVQNNTDYDCGKKQIANKYAQFVTTEYGIFAMINLLMKNIVFGLPFTPQQIINTYPNAKGNANYIIAVSQIMGVSPLIPIVWNKQYLEKLVKAIARYENGRDAIDSKQFEFAWTVLYNKPA